MSLWESQVVAKGYNPADFKWFPLMEDSIHPTLGLLGQTAADSFDQGDTLNREGHLLTTAAILHDELKLMSDNEYAFIKARYEDVMARLNDPKDPSNYRRTDQPGYWGSDWVVMSRDQITPNVTGWALANMTGRLGKTALWHLLRRALMFTTNTRSNWDSNVDYAWKVPDLTVLGYWTYYVRGMPKWARIASWPVSYAFCTIMDLDFLVNSCIKVWSYGKDPNNTDDIQHVASLALAYYRIPTVTAWAARKIYKLRPFAEKPAAALNAEDAEYIAENNTVQVVLNAYFRWEDPKRSPMLNELWKPIVKQIF